MLGAWVAHLEAPVDGGDALVKMERAMARDKIATNDRQLACARIASADGKSYLAAMAGACRATSNPSLFVIAAARLPTAVVSPCRG